MATITADSISAAHIQAAVDAASDGDIISVPAGEAVYDDDHKVVCTKGLIFQGNGIDSSIIYDETGGGSDSDPFLLTTKVGYVTQVTGFTFDGAAQGAASWGMVNIKGTYGAGSFRVHHNKFRNIKIRGVCAQTIFGVIDNNIFLNPYNLSTQAIMVIGDGVTAWTRALTLGTILAVFIEDNNFGYDYKGDGCMQAYHGARFVFRHNAVAGTFIEWHGCDSGDYRSPHSWEVYANAFSTDHTVGNNALVSRGGTGVIFNNAFTDAATWYQAMLLKNLRSITGAPGPYALGYCDGTSPCDGNEVDQQGYHCQDQNGWTSNGGDDGTGPNQILSPVYAWGNTRNGGAFDLSVDPTDRTPLHITENRDFYNTVHPTYTPYTYPHPLRGEGWEEGGAGGPFAKDNVMILK